MRHVAYDALDEALALMAQNRRDDALSRLEVALAAVDGAENPEVRATVARHAGLAYEHSQELSKAVRCFEIALSNDARDGRSCLALAALEQQRGNLGAANTHLRRAAEIAAETGDEELKSFIERSKINGGDDSSRA